MQLILFLILVFFFCKTKRLELDQINLFCLALTGFFPVAVIGCYMQATAD